MSSEEIIKLVDKSYRDVCLGHKKITLVDGEFTSKYNNYVSTHTKLEFGDIFLFEAVEWHKNDGTLSYPEIGLFVRYNIYDQALVTEYIPKERTWMNNLEYVCNPDPDKMYKVPVSDKKTEVVDFIEWYDTLYIYGKWDKMPSWKELKPYYEKTMWFNKTEEQIMKLKLRSLI